MVWASSEQSNRNFLWGRLYTLDSPHMVFEALSNVGCGISKWSSSLNVDVIVWNLNYCNMGDWFGVQAMC